MLLSLLHGYLSTPPPHTHTNLCFNTLLLARKTHFKGMCRNACIYIHAVCNHVNHPRSLYLQLRTLSGTYTFTFLPTPTHTHTHTHTHTYTHTHTHTFLFPQPRHKHQTSFPPPLTYLRGVLLQVVVLTHLPSPEQGLNSAPTPDRHLAYHPHPILSHQVKLQNSMFWRLCSYKYRESERSDLAFI
ncbi:hypothetical protein OTU49_007849 [Cherax quadricarinatus]|uniref:Uncharacterized protein n=1 Tax=Cherax quadricarinatus TaxID=27406 RepID=A0AAW0WT95_CHEQU